MKKILALLVAVLLLSSFFVLPAGAEEESLVDFIVDVEGGRQPRILQLADTQIIDPTQYRNDPEADNDPEKRLKDMEERCFKYLRQVIHNTKPDLILLTGDIVYGSFDDSGDALKELVKFFDSFGIPWAPVYGNHDNESNIGVLWQNEQFENAEHCLFKKGTATGNGNYTVGIRQNGKLTRVFFMMDSNGCNNPGKNSVLHIMPGGQGFLEDQVEWFVKQGTAIKEAHPDVNFTFTFHIPFKIFGKAMATATSKDMGLTASGNESFGLNPGGGADWDRDYAIYNKMKSLGTDSILVGHIHSISASVVYDGVRFQFGQKSSTYDSANYRTANGSIVATKDITAGEPLIGGTLMLMDEQTGDFVDFEIVLYKEPPKEEKPSDLAKWMPIICAVLPAILAAFVVFRNKRG